MAEQIDLFAKSAAQAGTEYGADDIQVLEGLTAVRKRPGMYIGSTTSSGLHHLVWEIVDNAVDEHLAKFCSRIDVTVHADNSVTVQDNGRGIPTGMHKTGIPTPQVVYTILHAGGKFGGGGYKKSGGLHGVGASVTNALSEWLEVEIYRDGKIHKMRFETWTDTAGKEHVGEPVTGLEVLGNTNKTGTKVTFKPDPKVFHGNVNLNYDTLAERLQEIAFLNSGLKVVLKDQRAGGKEETFYYEGGASQFVQFLNEDKTVLHDVIHFSAEKDDIEVEVALQYNDGYTETIASFVNSIPTRGGGTHETGFKTAYTRVMNEYARKTGQLKEKDKNLEGNDLREGMMAVINIKMADVEFVGQTKDQLGSASARSATDAVVSEKMAVFLEENPQVGQSLIRKAIQASRAREAARKARDEIRSGKKRSDSPSLGGKLSPAQSKDSSRNELFIVEGDSAGGSAKQGRDSKYQAILPLKGKPMNPEKAKLVDILKNDEYKAIIATIGAGIGSEFDVEESNYSKIIIMTDADTDGAHIQVLLLTFFYRYMKSLIDAGKVFIAQPPLYKITRKSGKLETVRYAWTDEQLQNYMKEIGKGAELQRYKGLGEMNPEQLWETTMNPETRTLLQVQIEDAAKAERRVSTLMGDKVDPRKRWIIDNVDFTEYEE
ncbi:DNA topoisomerase 4 subunit B [Cohnella xylanilytica]|uniref:DNA topoisomerase (ATP-hydrolyzing) n=1 Tax=Cohnella xylanilytica TaxID=557555 RepID=A0A841U3L8_9BACL|nr:DNA topoisomerase IV subunit B [Cohnella xylanilytica]MBB6694359.1 DNA topoisomerase IV subunit B [Cohnella xylanilytica]GIO10938.1 DNA topoisomerase 4 subunit B [Cohnella xylanilytica]